MKKIILSFVVLMQLSAVAQWNGNPAVNTAVCIQPNDQVAPKIVSDGAGGSIIVWQDSRDELTYRLYAQRLNASGQKQWADNGVILCSDGAEQFRPQIISDNAGGAIIVFEDGRNFSPDLYAQRIDANGNILWGTTGAVVCNAGGFQYYPQVRQTDQVVHSSPGGIQEAAQKLLRSESIHPAQHSGQPMV